MYGEDITRDRIAEAYPKVYPALESCASTLESLLTTLCRDRGVKVHAIEARAKHPDSLRDKLRRHPNYQRLSDVEDMCGARIVTFYQEDVTRIRDLLHKEFLIHKEESRHAESPDAFGYRSLHIIGQFDARRRDLPEYKAYAEFPVEFQVRTVLQHAWGVISHSLDYKNEAETPPEVRRKLFRLAALMETGDELFGSYRFEVESLRDRYRKQEKHGDWTELPVDLDSVTTSWKRLPIGEVVAVAKRAGFQEMDDSSHEESHRWSMGMLVSMTRLAGLETLGDLEKVMAGIGHYEPRLAELARISKENGFTPFANAFDLTAFAMILEHPELRVKLGTPFHPAIEAGLDAALRSGATS
ncbi:GTP pyrophosphokinase [Streptomyces naganishii]|uniref:GTP pyrophosphokinase n=1 Tax=Streptomyces naganishii JCM 4654 TaxID=1306179 RepID=A0A919CV36_9ACTN|nr:RelA/SpoT domain-containing protein [Streptomyces naganishii]GHD88168.1 GTP pyrophosphokinase [Streptomyces naganishii JCM 4654]